MSDKSIYQEVFEGCLFAAGVSGIFFALMELKKILARRQLLKLLDQLKEALEQVQENSRRADFMQALFDFAQEIEASQDEKMQRLMEVLTEKVEALPEFEEAFKNAKLKN